MAVPCAVAKETHVQYVESGAGEIYLMNLRIETEIEEDGRWIAEVPESPGVLAYGTDRARAVAAVEALALRVIVERLENGEISD